MPDAGHQPGPGQQPRNRDRRVTELTDRLLADNLLNTSVKAFGRDSARGIGLEWLRHSYGSTLHTGHVVYSLPYANWYRVQLDGIASTVGAVAAGDSGCLPIGPRSIGVIPPHSYVVVWLPPGRTTGIILSVFPPPNMDSRLICPDWISQGSQSGIKRETAYKDLAKQMYRQGGQLDFSAGRPLDGTTLEWGKITELGGGIMIDPFMISLRMSEMCGVFLNYWDQHTRLAGLGLDIQNPAFEISARDDEGETRYVESHNPYVWESLGLYASGTDISSTFSDEDVQMKRARGHFDLPDGKEDLQPISRYQEYGGYAGQGRRRTVMIPGKTTGTRNYADDPKQSPDIGVFEESIALDGTYSLRSAKQLFFVKDCLIPIPKEMNPPENQSKGDDARKDNYKFSGAFGGSAPHKIGDIDTTSGGPTRHLLTVAGLFDVLAYNFNWKPLHVFNYHKEDYTVPEVSDLQHSSRGGLTATQDTLSFTALSKSMYMGYPTPKQVKIDDRYQNNDFYQTQAGIAVLPDGSVVIFDGYGSQLTMSAGHIRLDCPGDIQMMPGRNVTALAGNDVMLRARKSFDITAGSGDGRLKAEHNLQMLGGNVDGGGILLETKSPGFTADFQNLAGEDVTMGGIMLRASHSGITAWGGDIYLRTGTTGSTPGDLQPGNITLDAAQGLNGQIVLKAADIENFVANGFAIAVGPAGTASNTDSVHYFGSQFAQLDGYTVINAGVAVMGGILGNGGCDIAGAYGSLTVDYVGKLLGGQFNAAISQVQTDIQLLRTTETTAHQTYFVSGLYAANQPGNDAVIRQAMFSYRDDVNGDQYIVHDDFLLAESRWQQFNRLSGSGDGSTWDEPVVNYQGRDLLPWPGKAKWKDSTSMLQIEKLKLFDAASGHAVDRAGGVYESPVLSGGTNVVLADNFKTVIQ